MAIALGWFVCWVAADNIRFLLSATRTTGVITNTQSIDEGGCYPTVQFQTTTGELVEFNSSSGGTGDCDIGGKLTVLYTPSDPSADPRISLDWAPIVFASVFSLAFFGIAYSLTERGQRFLNKRSPP
jgi:hypothetical protein